MRELDLWQRRLGRWLLRDHSAPSAIVLGDLGWRPWSSLALERAMSLWCRVHHALACRPSSAILGASGATQSGWSRAVSVALDYLGLLPQEAIARTQGAPERRRFLQRHIRPLLEARDADRWRVSLRHYRDPALLQHAQWVPEPMMAVSHTSSAPPSHASAWCRLRHGGSTLPGHRAGRHQSSGLCTLCSDAPGTTAHAILQCPALARIRTCWWARVRTWAPGPEVAELQPDAGPQWLFSSLAPPEVAAAHAWFAYQIEGAFARARRPAPCL